MSPRDLSQEGARPEGEVFDCVVIGGGPAGATAADDLARAGLADRNAANLLARAHGLAAAVGEAVSHGEDETEDARPATATAPARWPPRRRPISSPPGANSLLHEPSSLVCSVSSAVLPQPNDSLSSVSLADTDARAVLDAFVAEDMIWLLLWMVLKQLRSHPPRHP